MAIIKRVGFDLDISGAQLVDIAAV
jgi:hypothetical protein